MATELYGIRHGRTTWNEEGRIMGSVPGELSEAGIVQAEELGARVSDLRPDIIYAAACKRHMDTAAIVGRYCPGIPIEHTELLNERNFGGLEGKLKDEINLDAFWMAGPDDALFGAETMRSLVLRCVKFAAMVRDLHAGRKIVAVTSQGPLNRLYHLQEGNPFDPTFVDNTNAQLIAFDLERIIRGGQGLL